MNQHYEDLSEEARKIQSSHLKQQQCKNCRMEWSKRTLMLCYGLMCIVCLALGGICMHFSNSVKMQEFSPYSDIEDCKLEGHHNNTSWGKNCTVIYTLDYDFPTPIYFYYKITNFFQNHRTYVPSRTDVQLNGEDPNDVSDCSPIQKYKDVKVLPCGLIANSFFNDKINITHVDNKTEEHTALCPSTVATCVGDEQKANWSDATWYCDGTWEKSQVAWSSDKDSRFRPTQLKDGLTNRAELQTWQGVTLPDTDDVDLIVWMRTAASSTFTKLYRINRDVSFKKGDRLLVKIRNYFDVSDFHGSKALIISTSGYLGGKSDSLGLLFFLIAGLSAASIGVVYVFIPDLKAPEEDKNLS